jgi:hypothetical protein
MFKSIKLNQERKNILIIGAVLLLIGTVYRFYPVIHEIFSVSDEVDVKEKNIQKYYQIVSRYKGVEKEKNQLSRMLDGASAGLLTGKTPALAAVEAQGIINDIAAADNVKIETIQVLNTKESEDLDYILIPVKFSIKSNIMQLKDMIYKIESSNKLLVITELIADVGSGRENGEIRATLTAEGVMKGSPKEAAPPKKKLK